MAVIDITFHESKPTLCLIHESCQIFRIYNPTININFQVKFQGVTPIAEREIKLIPAETTPCRQQIDDRFKSRYRDLSLIIVQLPTLINGDKVNNCYRHIFDEQFKTVI